MSDPYIIFKCVPPRGDNNPGWSVEMRTEQGYKEVIPSTDISPDTALKIASAIDDILGNGRVVTRQVQQANNYIEKTLKDAIEAEEKTLERLRERRETLKVFEQAQSKVTWDEDNLPPPGTKVDVSEKATAFDGLKSNAAGLRGVLVEMRWPTAGAEGYVPVQDAEGHPRGCPHVSFLSPHKDEE